MIVQVHASLPPTLKSGLSSRLLNLTWPNTGFCGHLGSESVDSRSVFGLSLDLSLSLSYSNKNKQIKIWSAWKTHIMKNCVWILNIFCNKINLYINSIVCEPLKYPHALSRYIMPSSLNFFGKIFHLIYVALF